MRRLRTVGGLGLLLAALAVAGHGASTASAHALRVASTPDDGAVLQQPPTNVSITFGEEPDPRLSHIDVTDTAGRSHAGGAVSGRPGNQRQLDVAVHDMGCGVYTVSWRTVSVVDGHRAAGAFAFGIGVAANQVASASTVASSQGSSGPSAGAVVGRFILYVGVTLLLGALTIVLVVVGGEVRQLVAICIVGAGAMLVGSLVVGGIQARDADLGLVGVWSSSIGHNLAWRLLAAVSTVAALAVARLLRGSTWHRPALAAAAVGGMLTILADVAASHAAATGSWTWLNELGQWAHATAAAIWVGGLAALLLVLRQLAGAERGRAARRFSTTAAVALGVVAVTGVARASVELGSWGEVLGSAFGLLVVAKGALLVGLAGLGAVNRWRNVPHAARSVLGLRRIGGTEVMVATAALLTAATLVNVAPPQSASASAPAGPAPATASGTDEATTLRLALTASSGAPGFNEFTAQLSPYDTGGAPVDAKDIVLHFSLALLPDLGTSALTLRRTGPGSFSARGGNLAVDGAWSVSALVERGADSTEVPLVLETTGVAPRTDVSRVPGEPVLYTIHLSAGRTVQVYVDPPGPGRATVHATFFDAAGRGLTVSGGTVVGTPAGGTPTLYPIHQFEPGHYGADAQLSRARYRFDITAVSPTGERLLTHLDVPIGV